ncbi:uncharacterized protein [Amphiura filiformis]|uniref:uncharacterized protein n=1 Tax=Amphiura filiformis TaxID=82378 RepID=UPI003B227213
MGTLVHISRQNLTLVTKIGEGGFGSVYHMIWKKDPKNDVHVAAKRPYKVDSPELQILSKLCHPNIVKLIGIVPGELDFMLIFELCEGGSLRSYLNKNKKVPLEASLFTTWSKQAAKAIQYLHQLNIVHKDIKCENYLIATNNVLKLADFGLAKEMAKTCIATHRATWTHMAPELLESCELSANIDIFAYGVVVWEILTGQVPYEGMGFQAIVWHVCHENKRLEIPADCPTHVAELMTLCWQEDPKKRPSIDDVISILDTPYTEEQQQRMSLSLRQLPTMSPPHCSNNNQAITTFLDSNNSPQVGVWEMTGQFGHQDDGSEMPHLQQAGGIAISQDGRHVAISDIHAGYVNICDDTGQIKLQLPINNTAPRAPEFNRYSPHDVAISSDGLYFVTDFSCFVKIYDNRGTLKDKFPVVSPQNKPCNENVRLAGLATDNKGVVLVGATLLSTPMYEGFISKHTQTGTHVDTIPLTDGILPQFLAVTPLNTIILTSWSPPWMPNTSKKKSPQT